MHLLRRDRGVQRARRHGDDHLLGAGRGSRTGRAAVQRSGHRRWFLSGPGGAQKQGGAARPARRQQRLARAGHQRGSGLRRLHLGCRRELRRRLLHRHRRRGGRGSPQPDSWREHLRVEPEHRRRRCGRRAQPDLGQRWHRRRDLGFAGLPAGGGEHGDRELHRHRRQRPDCDSQHVRGWCAREQLPEHPGRRQPAWRGEPHLREHGPRRLRLRDLGRYPDSGQPHRHRRDG